MSTPADALRSFGTAYYPDHWPEAEWKDDLARIRDAGCTLVRFGEFSWSWFEPEPGRFDFGPYDRFVELTHEAGLQLCLCTPTATPPPWMDTLFPDGRMQDMRGRPSLHHRHFWCWHHRASWEKTEESLHALVERYAKHPALWGWQVDNEPNLGEDIAGLAHVDQTYDFHPEAMRDWVEWLQTQYKSLDELNERWWTNFWSQRFSSWEELARPRGRHNPQWWLAFRRFREWSIAELHVRRQARLIRGIDPQAYVGTNIPEAGLKISVGIGQDYREQAKELDWVGTDLYQASGNRALDLQWASYRCDVIRGAAAGAEFLLAESQGGPHQRAWPFGFAPEAYEGDYLEDNVEAYARRGVQQVWWFLWRPTLGGNEQGMNGVQNLDGTDSERTVTARRLAGRTKDFAAMRADWLARPVARLHYPRDSIRAMAYHPDSLQILDDDLCGWHGLLESAGYRVGVFFDEDFCATIESAAVGEPLVLPQSVLLTCEQVEALAATRGRVFSGPHTGLFDEDGNLRRHTPPCKLAQHWGFTTGFWNDTGKRPTLFGEDVPAFREVKLAGEALVGASFEGAYTSPALLHLPGGGLFSAFHAGAGWLHGSAHLREALRGTLFAETARA